MLRPLGPLAVTGSRVSRWGEHVSSRHCPLWRYRSWHRPRQHGVACGLLLHQRRLYCFGYPFLTNAPVLPWVLPRGLPLYGQPPHPYTFTGRWCPGRYSRIPKSMLAAGLWWCGVSWLRCDEIGLPGHISNCPSRDAPRCTPGPWERVNRSSGTAGDVVGGG